MKKIFLFVVAIISIVVFGSAFTASAQSNKEYSLSGVTVEQVYDQLRLRMTIDPSLYKMKTNRRLELTPVLLSKTSDDKAVFPTITIAGRNQWYYAEREGKDAGNLFRAGKGGPEEYVASVTWQPWMEYSQLDFIDNTTGCCGAQSKPELDLPVAIIDFRKDRFNPKFHYSVPKPEDRKERKIEGKAYVNFPVNKIEIYPNYMVNPVELGKITSSIDSVRYNPDATVKSIKLTGFASPEGPYSNNVRLAKGRTEAVKEYVRKQYTFPASTFKTDYVPEDWAGLRDSIANSSLADKAAMLDFIDYSNVRIEVKNDEFAKKFPASYAYLLKNVYPSLRHTNYLINYEVRTYTDVEEIKRVMKERPENLSLNEFFLAAVSYPVGSEEYDKIFELAAIYYPHSDVANMNAANSAMNEGDYKRARMLLKRVADSPEANYALAVLSAMEGDYEAARSGARQALEDGIAEAADTLNEIDRVMAKKDGVTFYPDFSDKK
ncbi:MAG: DUF3868 domain-containing protein [Muribaculaceae bacterium]|nr:DUF3868 domain-containing protein [Muribaculaceae bacterium]